MRVLGRLVGRLAKLELWGSAACLLALIFMASWQFIERNLAVHELPFWHTPPWTDWLIRHAVFVFGFLGGAYAAQEERHIHIDALTRKLGDHRRTVLRTLIAPATLAIVGTLTWASFGFYRIARMETDSAVQGALIMVIGYGLVWFHFLVRAINDVASLLHRRGAR